MPLTDFFGDQFRQIEAFMLDPAGVVRIVRVDPDLKPVLLRALVKMDDDASNPHLLNYSDVPFVTPEQYFSELLKRLEADYASNAEWLEAQGCAFTVPWSDPQSLHVATRFCMYASALAESLPDAAGSFVYLLDPAEVGDAESFRRSIEYIMQHVDTRWLKFIVLDPRLEQRLDGMEAPPGVSVQTFYMPPDEIEKKLNQSAQHGQGDSHSQRRTLGVLAGFAYGRKDYGEAARLQSEWARKAEAEGAPAEAASAYYNLGNTMLESGAHEHAEQYFVRSCQLCLEHSVNGVLPLALTNLGITLFRQSRMDEAVESLRVAYRTFKAQHHRPGEAFVFDALASAYYEQQRYDEAESAWLASHDIYAGITSDAFTDLRESGTRDIRAKLERFYLATGRPNRIDEPRAQNGGR